MKVLCFPYLSGNSTSHVMGSSNAVKEFVVEFDQSSEKKQLCFSPSWYGFPCVESISWDGSKVESVGKFTGESKSGSGGGAPSNKGGHGNSAVLYFGVSEPSNSFITSHLGKS